MQANYRLLKTDSGLQVGFAQLPDGECAAVNIHVPIGGRDDTPGKAGLAHFVEHMIFKGTANRSARQISLETEDAGASLNACTSEEQTDYEAHGDAETLPLLVEVLCDMVWNSTFPEDEIQLERDVIAEEIVMYHENPSDHIEDMLSKALWSPHPLGESIFGSLKSINSITREDLSHFVQEYYFRDNIVISVAGPFTDEQVLSQLNRHLPAVRPSTPRGDHHFEPSNGRAVVEVRETAQTQFSIAWQTFGRQDSQRHALRMLSMVLGEGSSSRLFQKLREDRGLCYQVSCDTSLLSDVGSFEICAGLDPASRDEALQCIRTEILDLAQNGPNPAEIIRAKRLNASYSRSAMESTGAHSSWVGDCLLRHRQVITPGFALEKFNAVTAEEVRSVAREFLVPSREAIAEIRPD